MAKELTVTQNVVANAFVTSSDERLKKNIININDALDRIGNLRGVFYEWRTDEHPEKMKGKEVGVIAQDFLTVLPEVLAKDKNDYYMVDYTRVVGLLIEAVKEMNTKINKQDNTIIELNNKILLLKDALLNMNEQLNSIQ